MKKFAILAIAALVAGSALANGWWEGSINLGGKTGDITAWSTSGDAPEDLGTLTSLSLSGLAFKFWTDSAAHSGADLYATLWDDSGSGSALGATTKAAWLGEASLIENTQHDYTIDLANGDGATDLVSKWNNVTLEDGKTYYLDLYAETYQAGGDAKEQLPTVHTKFVYSAPSDVPEPATMSLLGLGALALVLRRKLRK